MSVATGLLYKSRLLCLNQLHKFSLIFMYMKKYKPFEAIVTCFISAIKDNLMIRERFKMAQRRANYLHYRLNQMEKLMQENNPSTYSSGKTFNQIR